MEENETVQPEPAKEVAPAEPSRVSLGQVATEYARVYVTPDGNFNMEDYLVWLGNLMLDTKQALTGK